jgi:hypothetical protein
MKFFVGLIIAILASLASTGIAAAQTAQPDLVLTGTISGKDHQTYVEVPFVVPQGVERLTIAFEYTGKEARTVIDLGLSDPNGLRGWSGGNKSTITIATSDATPSYVPGPVVAGQWKLLFNSDWTGYSKAFGNVAPHPTIDSHRPVPVTLGAYSLAIYGRTN